MAGQAAFSQRSLFLFGPPGNGKTHLGHLVNNVFEGGIWIPHCIAIENNIIRIFEAVVEADQAYGQRRDDLVIEVPRADIPAEIELAVGQRLQIQSPDGNVTRVVVSDLDEASATLDANHPLAGKDLTFEVELVEIV